MNTTGLQGSEVSLLLIDDDADAEVVVKRMLRSSPLRYRIEWIGDAEPGALRNRMAAGAIGAILLDHRLATTTGDALLRQIGPVDQMPPVIVLSQTTDPAVTDVYLGMGVADYLAKDELNPGLLDRTIRLSLRQRAQVDDERRRHETLLRQERMATIGVIAAGVAHEYNNLNAVILAALELGGKPGDITIERAMSAIERSRRISNALLAIGRPNASTTACDIVRQILDTIALLDSHLLRQDIRVATHLPEGPINVSMHPGDLHQVLSNLVINAADAMWNSTDRMVSVGLTAKDDEAILTITDKGVGIDPDDMPRIFDLFFTRKRPGEAGSIFEPETVGTGLGLPLCRSLIEQNGGTISVRSWPGTGTAVTVRLPRSHTAERQSDSTAVVTLGSLRGRRIAVIEDNIDLGRLIADGLATYGCEVEVFNDPTTFPVALRQRHFDAAVLDWIMPGLDGAGVLLASADAERRPPLPVIIVSGGDVVHDQPPPGVSIAGFLPKPYRHSALALCLARILSLTPKRSGA